MDSFADYNRVDRTISSGKAQLITFLISIPIVLLIYLPFYFLWGDKAFLSQSVFKSINIESGLIVFAVLIFGIIIHELIHGITWAFFSKSKFKSIRFGIIWKYMMPYCHVNEPLRVNQYLLGVITPFLFVGLLPVVISFINGNINLMLFGMFFVIAAGGDFMIAWNILKEDKSNFILDHPELAGYILLFPKK